MGFFVTVQPSASCYRHQAMHNHFVVAWCISTITLFHGLCSKCKVLGWTVTILFLLWVSISSSAIFVSIFLKSGSFVHRIHVALNLEHVFASFHSWSFNINITIFKFKIANLNNKVNETRIGIAFFSEVFVKILYWRSKRLTAQYKVMHTAA